MEQAEHPIKQEEHIAEEEFEEEEAEEEEEEKIEGEEKPVPPKPILYPLCRYPVLFILIIHIFMTYVETEIHFIIVYLQAQNYGLLSAHTIYDIYMIMGGIFCFIQGILADCYFSRLKTLIYGYIPQMFSFIFFYCWYYTKYHTAVMYLGVIFASTAAGSLCSVIISIGLNQFTYPEQYWSCRNFMYLYVIQKSAIMTVSTLATPKFTESIKHVTNPMGITFLFQLGFLLLAVTLVALVRKYVPDKQLDVGRFTIYGKIIVKAIKLNRELDEELPGHFLDIAKPKFGDYLVDSLKQIFVLFIISLPLLLFWSFYCAEINIVEIEYIANSFDYETIFGELSSVYITPIKHTITIVNVLVYKFIITPILRYFDIKINFVREILAGMFILLIRFCVYHYINDIARKTLDPIYPQEGSFSVRFYNPTSCFLTIFSPAINIDRFHLPPMEVVEFHQLPIYSTLTQEYQVETECPNFLLNGYFECVPMRTTGIAFSKLGNIKFFFDDKRHTDKIEVDLNIIIMKEFPRDDKPFVIEGPNFSPRRLPEMSVEPYPLRPGTYTINKNLKFEVNYKEATVVLIFADANRILFKPWKIPLKSRLSIYFLFLDFMLSEWGDFLYTIGAFQFYYFNGPAGLKTISLACHYMFTKGLSHMFGHLISFYIFQDVAYWRMNYLDQVISLLMMIISMYLYPSIIFKFRNDWKWIKNEESTREA